MKYNLKIQIITKSIFLIIGSIVSNTIESAQIHSIEITTNENKTASIALPFKYKKLSKNEKNHLTYVPEYCYTILNKDNPIALVGPLQPCKLVAIKNKKTEDVIIFHKHDGNSTKKLCSMAYNFLNKNTNPEDIQAYIFGISSKNIEKEYSENPLPGIPSTQKHKIQHIKKSIEKKFNLDKEQIRAQMFLNKDGILARKNTFYGEIFILIDKDLNKHCCCPVLENVFQVSKKTHNKKNYVKRIALEIKKRNKKVEELFPHEKRIYERDRFLRAKK